MRNLILKPYQRKAVEKIITHERCNIWAEMGMGKTVSVLAAIDALKLMEDLGPVLVVAPLRVAQSVWPKEVEEWNQLKHLKVATIVGTPKQRLAALKSKADIYTVNYENIKWLIDTLGDDWPFDMVVADESTRLKNFKLRGGTKRAKALAKRAHSMTKRWVNLTGTPSPNGVINLWGQQWFVDRGERLGRTFTAFTDRWFTKNFNGFGVELIEGADIKIQKRVAPTVCALRAQDYFDLKEPIRTKVLIDLPRDAFEQYRQMEREMFVQIKDQGEVEAFNMAAKTMKCLQIANGFAYDAEGRALYSHDEKLEALRRIVEEANGKNILVAYHFREDATRIKETFPDAVVLGKNPKVIDEWNEGKIPMLLTHPASAGHGLNLQHGGHHLVFYSHWWDLEQHQQITERIGPMRQKQAGYERPVYVYHILARGTIEEDVLTRLTTKKSMQELLMERSAQTETP